VTLNQGRGEVCRDISVSDLTSPVILAHIHSGAAGTNGRWLSISTARERGSTAVSTPRSTDQAIRQDPGDYYVNVRTRRCSRGEVRGQLG
jgi:hypothetical protein